ncbi:hypothetical protein [Enterobacter hormaechei]|uniref:hypothetical protein n=1 Tax=Enterobacter hormaechei TaxID=158836 RepID=UPI002E172F5C|nr:hypothetical protein [Enterobacter hormaechei]
MYYVKPRHSISFKHSKRHLPATSTSNEMSPTVKEITSHAVIIIKRRADQMGRNKHNKEEREIIP